MHLYRLAYRLVPVLLAASTLTCGGDLNAPHSDPTTMKAVGGDGQVAPVGAVLPVPLVILVTDAEGRAVPGVAVAWEARGGGTVSDGSVKTDDDGRASVQRTLGGETGDVSTIATVDGLAGSPVTFTATAQPAGSESMGLAVVPPTSVLDDEVFPPAEQPTVKVVNADGDPVSGREVTVSIGSGGGAVRGQVTAVTNGQGVATFGDLGIDGTGAQRLKFTSGSISVQSSTITVAALPAEATTGKWGPVISWPIVPLHMHFLPNGNILAWGRQDQPWVWTPPSDGNPAGAGSFVEVPATDMLFCSGHAFMPDGRLMVSGGHLEDDRGLRVTNFFTPNGSGGSWSNANGALMAAGRWYPTVTVLPNGRVLTMAGRDAASAVVGTSEIWTGSQWEPVTNAFKQFPYYPRNFVAPDGRVFYAGERIQSWWLSITSSNVGQWTSGPSHRWPYNRDYGSAVMYDDGKIMYVGGGGDPKTNNPHDATSAAPTSSAELIDLNASSPNWTYTDSMQYRRRHLTALALPNGEVLVTGGVASGGALNNLSTPTQAAEIWSPASGQWRTLASNAVPRGYHAVSLLMPNGLVLHGASGDAFLPDGSAYPRQMSHEMFSPPYLFKGNRPTVTSAPSAVGYGETFFVETPYAAQIAKVRWIRLASVTHAFDMNQRVNTLSFTRTADGLNVAAPASGNRAPPGHYLLFLLNRNGVPSVGRVIRIG